MKKKQFNRIILVMCACILAYAFLLPLLFMLFTSFKGLAEAMTSSTLLPKKWTLDNYRELFASTSTAPIFQWLFNTAIVTVSGTVLRITTSVLAAYALARLPVPGKRFIVCLLYTSYLLDEQNKVYLLDEGRDFFEETLWGKYVSFLPLTQEVKGITLTGFKYPLQEKDIEIGTSLCISNELAEEEARIQFREGVLICVESHD